MATQTITASIMLQHKPKRSGLKNNSQLSPVVNEGHYQLCFITNFNLLILIHCIRLCSCDALMHKSGLYHKQQFTLFLFLSFRWYQPWNGWAFPRWNKCCVTPAENKSTPGFVARLPSSTLHFIAPPLCPGGHLHLEWPESAWRCRKGWDSSAAHLLDWGIRTGFSRNPLFFQKKKYLSGLSPSVSEKSWCWKWERQFPP